MLAKQILLRISGIKISLILTLSLIIITPLQSSENDFPLNLLFSRDDIPRIRENTQLPIFKDYWQSVLNTDIEKDKNFCREAFIYAVTGDVNRGQKARKEMLKLLQQERWDYFLEDGKHTLGFLTSGRLTAWISLSYDWLYDLLTPEERSELLKQLAEKGCVPCYRALYGMRYPETVKGWSFDPEQTRYKISVPDMSRWPVILGRNNFRAVISGGFALATFALIGKDNRTDEWLELLEDSHYRFAAEFKPDGSYEEGVAYCNYGMSYLIYVMEIFKRKKNIDLFDAANFVGMADFNLATLLPHHLQPEGSVNFGDAGRNLNTSINFWVARKSRDGLSQYIALNYPAQHDIFSLIWYDPTVKPIPPTKNNYFSKLDIGWIVTRTGYEMDDLVVAMRSGPPANHEHGDRNSIILKHYGEVLLADNKRPTYDRLNPGWLLRTSPAHNTVLIDGQGHQYHNGEEGTNESKASAKIIGYGERQGYTFWTSDATQAYSLVNSDVKSVTRTTLVFQEFACLIVLDKLIKKEQASTFSARWHIENKDDNGKSKTDNNSFIISRPNAKFYGICAGIPEVDITSERLPIPDSLGVYPFVNIKSTKKVKEAFIVHAGCSLQPNDALPEIEINNDKTKWTIKVTLNNSNLVLNIFNHSRLPKFELVEYAKQ